MREISSIYVQLLTGLSANIQVYQEERPSDKEDLLARINQAGSRTTETQECNRPTRDNRPSSGMRM